MIEYMEPAVIESNLRTFCHWADGQVNEGAELRPSYFAALNRVQRFELGFDTSSNGPRLIFDFADPRVALLLETVTSPLALQPVSEQEAFSDGEKLDAADAIGGALTLLGEYDPALPTTVNRLVATLLFLRAPGYEGGSFWHALGAVWVAYRSDRLMVHWAENLLHETVHQALFLEDMVNGLFTVDPDVLASESCQVTSAIRQIKRPYDAAFHAATVAVVLADFYANRQKTTEAASFLTPLTSSLEELAGKAHLLSPRGRQILIEIESAVKTSATRPLSLA